MSFEDYTDELARLQPEYASVKPEEAGGEVPDGTYHVSVHTVQVKRSKTGNLMLAWQLKIISPAAYSKRFLFRHNMLMTRDNLVWLKRDLSTCGLESPENITQLPNSIVELLNRVLLVRKETRDKYTNIEIDNLVALDVRDYVPVDQQGFGVITGQKSDVPF